MALETESTLLRRNAQPRDNSDVNANRADVANRRFSQADIVRAVKGFENAGLKVGAVRIEADGTIGIIAAGHDVPEDDWDEWRRDSPLYRPIERERERPNAYSVRTLADRWTCSEQLIRNMIKRGELRFFRHGNLIRITADAVAEVEAKRDLRPGSG